jgi:hypothetical protein
VCCDAENIGVDIAAFHWAADMYSRNAIGSVIAVNVVTSTPAGTTTSDSTSLFVDMLASHSSEIKTRIIRIYNVFGESQPSGQGIIARIVHDVAARKPVLDIPVNHCGGYIYVTDAARAVFSVVTESDETASMNSDTTTVESSGRSIVVIRNELLVATSVILAEILSVAPPDYVPDVTSSFFDSDPSSVCSIKSGVSTTSSYLQIELSTPSPSPSLSATLQWITSKLACRSLRDGIQEIMKSTMHDTGDMNGSNKKKKVYSSVQCTAGHQTFPEDWHFYEDDYNSIDNRVCMFENICLLDKRLVYFQHEAETDAPDYAKLSFFQNSVFLFLANIHDLNVQIDVAPKQHIDFDQFEYIDDKSWYFSHSTVAFNFAHLMLDDLYPALSAMNVFDTPPEESQLLYFGCERYTFLGATYTAQSNNSYNLDEEGSWVQLCHQNYKIYSELVFGQAAVDLKRLDDKNVCFKKLVMGQSKVFPLRVVDKQRAVTMRRGRDMIIKNIGLDHTLRPKSLSILVLPKTSGHADSIWPDMCFSVTRIVRDILLLDNIPVRCSPYNKDRTLKDEILLVHQATFIIAEHGTISVLPLLYASEGAVLLSVAEKEYVKDGDILPYATHLQVFYETVDNKDSIADVIRLCLHRAADRFNIKFEE